MLRHAMSLMGLLCPVRSAGSALMPAKPCCTCPPRAGSSAPACRTQCPGPVAAQARTTSTSRPLSMCPCSASACSRLTQCSERPGEPADAALAIAPPARGRAHPRCSAHFVSRTGTAAPWSRRGRRRSAPLPRIAEPSGLSSRANSTAPRGAMPCRLRSSRAACRLAHSSKTAITNRDVVSVSKRRSPSGPLLPVSFERGSGSRAASTEARPQTISGGVLSICRSRAHRARTMLAAR